MSAETASENVHATAIVVGTAGLLFMGASGSGKSASAFACLAEAAARGVFAALIADDQVLVSAHGGAIVARAPVPTAGLMEMRGSGIVRLGHISGAVMHLAVLVGSAGSAQRLPEPAETVVIGETGSLPAIRLWEGRTSVLATLAGLRPQLLPIGGMRAACPDVPG
ncbi:MAG TPA: hypothetical protein VFJ18_04995 [Pararhizobium sp.]|nr:hypothetical protein [Pararhizobium sp.]